MGMPRHVSTSTPKPYFTGVPSLRRLAASMRATAPSPPTECDPKFTIHLARSSAVVNSELDPCASSPLGTRLQFESALRAYDQARFGSTSPSRVRKCVLDM